MAAHSSVLVANKPTDGLDSSTARELVQNAKEIAKTGESFVFNLVQPSPDVVNLFDHVLVLRRGKPVYWGPPNEMSTHFEQLGFVRPVEKGAPDFVDELTREPFRFFQGPRALKDASTYLEESFLHSAGFRELGDTLWRELHPTSFAPVSKSGNVGEYLTTFMYQVYLAVQVQWATASRHVEVLWGGLARVIFVSIMVGTAFWDMGRSQDDARNGLGLLFYVLTYMSFIPTQLVPVLFEERAVFLKQRAEKYFRPIVYFTAKSIFVLPSTFLETLIMISIVFPLANMPGSFMGEQFWYLFLSAWLLHLCSTMFIVIIALSSPSSVVGQALAPVLSVLVFVSGGYFVPRNAIPTGW